MNHRLWWRQRALNLKLNTRKMLRFNWIRLILKKHFQGGGRPQSAAGRRSRVQKPTNQSQALPDVDTTQSFAASVTPSGMVNQAFDDPDIEEVITNVETKQKTVKVRTCTFMWSLHQVLHQVLHRVLHRHELTQKPILDIRIRKKRKRRKLLSK